MVNVIMNSCQLAGISSRNARHITAFWWPLYSRLTSPVSTLHSRATPSDEAANKNRHDYNFWLLIHISNHIFQFMYHIITSLDIGVTQYV